MGFYSINFIIEIQLLLLEFSSISPQCNSVCMFASYSLVLPISLERLTLTSKQASHEQHPAPLYWGFPEPLRTCVHPQIAISNFLRPRTLWSLLVQSGNWEQLENTSSSFLGLVRCPGGLVVVLLGSEGLGVRVHWILQNMLCCPVMGNNWEYGCDVDNLHYLRQERIRTGSLSRSV